MLAPTIQLKGSLMQHINEPTKTIIDGLSVATVLGTIATYLPPIAALFTIIWTAIRIWETDTVKKWTGR
jgi:glycerol-3-phosphate acyltransferase PlsY